MPSRTNITSDREKGCHYCCENMTYHVILGSYTQYKIYVFLKKIRNYMVQLI